MAQLKIYDRDMNGIIRGRSDVNFKLSSPLEQNVMNCKISDHLIRITGCVIPGIDPRKNLAKDCQDTYKFTEKENLLLATLFDGHGREGKKVSHFCREYMINYFNQNYEEFNDDPLNNIERMTVLSDEALKNTGIDCSLSGTTAVIVVFNSSGIHSGGVGDSRAILSTLPRSNIEHSQNFGYSNIFKRPVQPARHLKEIPLTIDQKPNHTEELRRIIAAGGYVEKIKDDMGHEIGPYRV